MHSQISSWNIIARRTFPN